MRFGSRMYIALVPNRSSPPAVLLRESYRDGDSVKTRTLANLTRWPADKVEALRRVLKGETSLSDPTQRFQIERSLPHGHVAAVLGMAVSEVERRSPIVDFANVRKRVEVRRFSRVHMLAAGVAAAAVIWFAVHLWQQISAPARELAELYLRVPELTRRNTRVHFIHPLKERLVREVGYGLALEGASAADLVKSMQSRAADAGSKEQVA